MANPQETVNTSMSEEKIALEHGGKESVHQGSSTSGGTLLGTDRSSQFSPNSKPSFADAPSYKQPVPDCGPEYAPEPGMATDRPRPDPADQTVTPLHLLGDQPDTVDCPFCRYRVETTVKKPASRQTKILSVALFFTTLFGVVAPFLCHWAAHVDQYCSNCKRRVARKAFGSDSVDVFGTPEHLREASRFPAAPGKANGKGKGVS